MEGIIDADYMQAKRVCQDVEIKHLDEYHVLYVQSDTLLLADVFENFLNMSTEIYKLDFARFLLAQQSVLKKSKVKFDLLIDTDMLLIVEKIIRAGICHAIHRYVKAYNRYMKDYDKNKEQSYLKHWNVNNQYR